MTLWDKLQQEIDKAGTAAKDVLDEGKLRIDLFRARQLADRAAEALGYAVHRARRDGREMDAETLERLDATLREHNAAAERIDAELKKQGAAESPKPGDPATPDATGATGARGASGASGAATAADSSAEASGTAP
jgi:hypothetical protein